MSNQMKTRVSVVIPAHDEGSRIRSTLALLLAQTYQKELVEIIVVNNNSTDDTAAIARQLGVRLVDEHNPGVAWAREAGWRKASGDIILSTDADAQPGSDWIARIVEFFDSHPDMVGVSGGMRFFDKPRWFNWAAAVLNPFLVYLGFCMSRGVFNFTGNNMAARRWAYEKVGGFNTSLHFGEDMDLARKLRTVGRIGFQPGLIMWVSGRRYALNMSFWRYCMNYLWTSVFAYPKYNELPKVK